MNLFQRSNLKLDLTPGERAFIKLLQSLLYSVLITAIIGLTQFLSGHSGAINWMQLLQFELIECALSVALTLSKYFSAQGDAPLSATITAAVNAVAQKANEPVPAQVVDAPAISAIQ